MIESVLLPKPRGKQYEGHNAYAYDPPSPAPEEHPYDATGTPLPYLVNSSGGDGLRGRFEYFGEQASVGAPPPAARPTGPRQGPNAGLRGRLEVDAYSQPGAQNVLRRPSRAAPRVAPRSGLDMSRVDPDPRVAASIPPPLPHTGRTGPDMSRVVSGARATARIPPDPTARLAELSIHDRAVRRTFGERHGAGGPTSSATPARPAGEPRRAGLRIWNQSYDPTIFNQPVDDYLNVDRRADALVRRKLPIEGNANKVIRR